MPAPKKTAAKNKKKQSFFQKLGSKLQSPKNRVIAVVLLFAVVGGGLMVYRSFAYTTQASLIFFPSELKYDSNILTSDSPNSSKGGLQVIQGWIVIDSSRLPAAQTRLVNFLKQYPNKTARVCTSIRSIQVPSSTISVEIRNASLSGDGSASSGQKTINSTFQDICTPNFVIRGPNDWRGVNNAYIAVSSQDAFISNIKVEIFDISGTNPSTGTVKNPTPTPAPAPANPTPVVEPTCGKNCKQ